MRVLLIVIGVAALAIAPFVFYPLFLIKLLCMCLFACAFNLVVGSAGLLSFGHAAFFGGAAYIAAQAAKVWGLPFELAIAAGVAFSTLLGAIFGYVSIRQQGLFFAMVTLALAQMIYFLALQLPFTHSEDGIQSVPRGHLFGLIDLNNPYAMYFTVVAIFIISYAIIHRIIHSPFGQILNAIRENPARATSLGYRIDDYRLVAFVLSAAFSGLAGSLKAISFQFASLADVHWTLSGDVILMTLLGGMGTTFGPVVGAAVVLGLDEFLAEKGLPTQAIIGAIFIACVLLFRRGIVGEIARAWTRVSR
jgi:branched-chain amino acid transport system permease protein